MECASTDSSDRDGIPRPRGHLLLDACIAAVGWEFPKYWYSVCFVCCAEPSGFEGSSVIHITAPFTYNTDRNLHTHYCEFEQNFEF